MIIAMVAALVASAAQGSAGERLIQADLAGFAEAHRVESANGMIVEWVPRGESVERWTRMVTHQRFAGAALRLRPHDLLDNMIAGLRTGCPGARTSEVTRFTVSGRPAARFRADCPLNPSTRMPETFTALAIAGEADMHVAQVAFRRVPSASDDSWAETQLRSVRLCGADSKETACAAR